MAEASGPPSTGEAFALFLDKESDRLSTDGTYVTVKREVHQPTGLPAPTEVEIVFCEEAMAATAVQEMIQRLNVETTTTEPEPQTIKPGFTRVLSGYGGQDLELSFTELESPRHPAVTHEWAVTLRGFRRDDPNKTTTFGPNANLYLRGKGWLLPIEIMEDGESLKKYLALKGVNVPLKPDKK